MFKKEVEKTTYLSDIVVPEVNTVLQSMSEKTLTEKKEFVIREILECIKDESDRIEKSSIALQVTKYNEYWEKERQMIAKFNFYSEVFLIFFVGGMTALNGFWFTVPFIFLGIAMAQFDKRIYAWFKGIFSK